MSGKINIDDQIYLSQENDLDARISNAKVSALFEYLHELRDTYNSVRFQIEKYGTKEMGGYWHLDKEESTNCLEGLASKIIEVEMLIEKEES